MVVDFALLGSKVSKKMLMAKCRKETAFFTTNYALNVIVRV